MDNLDYPCVCGHLAGKHAMLNTNLFKYCLVVVKPIKVYAIQENPQTCECNDFKADNLRYLESLNG